MTVEAEKHRIVQAIRCGDWLAAAGVLIRFEVAADDCRKTELFVRFCLVF
jgi:hypothetical protein